MKANINIFYILFVFSVMPLAAQAQDATLDYAKALICRAVSIKHPSYLPDVNKVPGFMICARKPGFAEISRRGGYFGLAFELPNGRLVACSAKLVDLSGVTGQKTPAVRELQCNIEN